MNPEAVLKFGKEVYGEAKKISWSNKREVIITTLVIALVVILVSCFFLLADFILYKLIYFLMEIGSNK